MFQIQAPEAQRRIFMREVVKGFGASLIYGFPLYSYLLEGKDSNVNVVTISALMGKSYISQVECGSSP